jgi:hypothetical protein
VAYGSATDFVSKAMIASEVANPHNIPVASLKQISKSHFDILCMARQPFVDDVVWECEWWADEAERVIGTVVLDRTDEDWSFMVLGRDENGLFRGMDMGTCIESQKIASERLQERLLYHSDTGDTVFPQGDVKGNRNDILIPLVARERLHSDFRHLIEDPQYSAARRVIEETAYAFADVDGNYIRDFQTTGFNGRLWELYLFKFLSEQRFILHREFSRPDYCASNGISRVGIEAVTVNPTAGEVPPIPKNNEEVRYLLNDYMPLKFGSPLFSKLGKRYWEDSHMTEVPLMFAIHDFHCGNSMIWSAPALHEYLYGLRVFAEKNEQGVPVAKQVPIVEHVWNGKKRPSGFFKQPDAEHISAVLFSNASTLSKFNRMGCLAGFADLGTIMYRQGFKENPDPDALTPVGFSLKVDPSTYKECWSEDVQIFHNPNALRPLPEDLFEGCVHNFLQDGEFYRCGPEERVISSVTFVATPE